MPTAWLIAAHVPTGNTVRQRRARGRTPDRRARVPGMRGRRDSRRAGPGAPVPLPRACDRRVGAVGEASAADVLRDLGPRLEAGAEAPVAPRDPLRDALDAVAEATPVQLLGRPRPRLQPQAEAPDAGLVRDRLVGGLLVGGKRLVHAITSCEEGPAPGPAAGPVRPGADAAVRTRTRRPRRTGADDLRTPGGLLDLVQLGRRLALEQPCVSELRHVALAPELLERRGDRRPARGDEVGEQLVRQPQRHAD